MFRVVAFSLAFFILAWGLTPTISQLTWGAAFANTQNDKQDQERSRSPQGIPDNADERRDRVTATRERKRLFRRQTLPRDIRSYDGSGNNIDHPDWGASFSRLKRIADADYADGVASLAGPLRPSARIVSNEIIHQAEDAFIENEFGTSDFLWQWGQFLDHDIDLTDGSTDEAANIIVPKGDSYFDPLQSGDVIIPFNRAIYDLQSGTDASNPREQENEITSWIDASMIYGSDDERAAALRVGPNSPYLKMSPGKLLPYNERSLANANGFVADPTSLFLAGDVRANEQIGLTVMHTLFVREHNRLARKLKRRMPRADAETIFQSARRIVIAEIQIITYNEFLPALIGENALPPYTRYKATVDPTIINEFSAAAYRLGHSMLSSEIMRIESDGDVSSGGNIALRDAFFTGPSYLKKKKDIDPILRGLAMQTHQRIDAKVISDVRNFLFGAPGAGGFDLASLNIQRGRDHGLASYNETREAFGLPRVSNFSEISSDPALQLALFKTYGSVDNIDLWVGGLAEDPVHSEGSQVGPLFREILARQFTALRDGDRFWYKRDLNKLELSLVRKTTLARIIRRNTGIRREIPNNVFYVRDVPRDKRENRFERNSSLSSPFE